MTRIIASYSLPPSQRVYLIFVGILVGLAQLLNDNPLLAIGFVALFLFAFFAQARFRTDVREDGIETVGNLIGNRVVPWGDITDIEDSSLLTTHSIRVTRGDGSKFRLPAPVDGPMLRDASYAEKLELILDEWRRRSGGVAAGSAPDGAVGIDPQ